MHIPGGFDATKVAGAFSSHPVNINDPGYEGRTLNVIENVPFTGKKMLVPSTLLSQVLERLHATNQGVTGMLANARDFFWPDLDLDAAVRKMRLQCRQCNEQALSQSAEHLINTTPSDVPFQQVVADLFALEGHTFLAYAD